MLLILNQNKLDSLSGEDINSYEITYGRSALATTNISITDNTSSVKNQTGANFYTSFAAYYHPDPSSSTGFPYIRKDGIRNIELDAMSDRKYFQAFCNTLTHLSLTYYITKNEIYAQKAVELIRGFFVLESTRMNPDLTYSGLVVGDSMNDLRIRGAIIDTNKLSIVTDLITLLQPSQYWTAELQSYMETWFDTLASWFKTSERGVLQSSYSHNIKTSYVNQLCSYLCFCGKSNEARTYLENNVYSLLSAQINSEGNQILEMDRAINKHYSNFNLTLLFTLAKICKSLGLDIYNYMDNNGQGSMQKAAHYLSYYYLNPSEWSWSSEANDPVSTKAWVKDAVVVYDDVLLQQVYDQVKHYDSKNILHTVSLPN